MGCHISTSALYTKRGSQTWSLRLHPSHLIFLSFTSVEDHKKPSELRASCRSVGSTGLIARVPKHFVSHGTRQEVKAVIRKFSLSSENTRVLPQPVWNNTSNWKRKSSKDMLVQCWAMGQDLAASTGNVIGSKLQAGESLWAMRSWEFQSHRVGREQQGWRAEV